MPQSDALRSDIGTIGLDDWYPSLTALLNERLADRAHGDMSRWRKAIEALPEVKDGQTILDAAAVSVSGLALSAGNRERVQSLLMQLIPWRKGPFVIDGIEIDSEWRSDLKWNRLHGAISALGGRRVLDVGCGNGYYAYRMRGAGAALVIGIDPTLIYVAQFRALQRFFRTESVHVLPLRLIDLPRRTQCFDTTFSMGVLYHQRDPGYHLAQLWQTLRPGGELVLETLVHPGTDETVIEVQGRYARMRNIWYLPTLAALESWLQDAGFRKLRLIDVARTTPDEQRTTSWMPFESLADALDPGNPERTVEGLPAPTRAVIVCVAP